MNNHVVVMLLLGAEALLCLVYIIIKIGGRPRGR